MYFFCGMETLSARDEFPDSPNVQSWQGTSSSRAEPARRNTGGPSGQGNLQRVPPVLEPARLGDTRRGRNRHQGGHPDRKAGPTKDDRSRRLRVRRVRVSRRTRIRNSAARAKVGSDERRVHQGMADPGMAQRRAADHNDHEETKTRHGTRSNGSHDKPTSGRMDHNRTSAECTRLGTSRSATQRRKQSPNHESRKHHGTGARSGPAVDVPERQALRQLAAARPLRVRAAGPVRVPIEKHVRDEWHHRGIPTAADQGRAPLHPAEPPRGQAPLEARPLLGPSSERGRVRTLRHNHRELGGSFRTETRSGNSCRRQWPGEPRRPRPHRTPAPVLRLRLGDPPEGVARGEDAARVAAPPEEVGEPRRVGRDRALELGAPDVLAPAAGGPVGAHDKGIQQPRGMPQPLPAGLRDERDGRGTEQDAAAIGDDPLRAPQRRECLTRAARHHQTTAVVVGEPNHDIVDRVLLARQERPFRPGGVFFCDDPVQVLPEVDLRDAGLELVDLARPGRADPTRRCRRSSGG